MTENWREILNNWFKCCIPLLISILWEMIVHIPLKMEIGGNARPMMGLMCVYFWIIYRPDIFNLAVVFIFALVCDLLSLAPLGVYLFMYLIMFLAVSNLIKYVSEKTFKILWIGLIVLLLPIMMAGWLMMCIYYAEILPLKSLFFSYLFSISLYPIVGGINAFIVNRFMQEDDG